MTVNVDASRCIGCGMCAAAVPAVFQIQGRVSVVQAQPRTPAEEAGAFDAAAPIDRKGCFFRQEPGKRRRFPGSVCLQRFCASGLDFCCASRSSTRMVFESMKPFGVRCQRPSSSTA